MPAVTAAVGVSGAAVRAVERGSTGVLAPSVSPVGRRPILLIAGDSAHSRYFSEDAYAAAAEPKNLVIIEDANHVDLYDRFDKIPFDTIAEFFGTHLA